MPKESDIRMQREPLGGEKIPTTTPKTTTLSQKEIETIILLIIGVVLFIIGISLLSSTVFSLNLLGAFMASLGFLALIVKILVGAIILAIGIVIIIKTIRKYEES